jgi:hypothetical protein
MTIKVVNLTDQDLIQEFLQLPVRLYKNEKNWIRPLDKDIESVFNPKTNKYFGHGSCIRWVLQSSSGETIGRVAAFIDKRTANKGNEQPTGGMGFFECINDKDAAFLLFDTCKAWLQENGMEAMDGPINFGDRDRWWGLLVDGFEEPNYCMPYNHLYYKDLFEAYGFQEYFQQYTYRRIIADDLKEKTWEKAKRVRENPDFRFDYLHLNNMEKYAEDFRTIYNKAWSKHSGVREMPKIQAISIMKQIKPILDEKLILFAYYKEEPAAFFIMLPEMNQVFKHFDGNFNQKNPWHLLKFLWHKKIRGLNKIFGVVFGVVPEQQGKGVEAALMAYYKGFAHASPNYPYKVIEMNWIGDFNPKMIRVVTDIGAEVYKTHVTFRKLFDETKPFKRCPMIG